MDSLRERLKTLISFESDTRRCFPRHEGHLFGSRPSTSEIYKRWRIGTLVLTATRRFRRPHFQRMRFRVCAHTNCAVGRRMVTGDNIHTAKAIAAECGILKEGGLVGEGRDFRTWDDAKPISKALDDLVVHARSFPLAKLKLVKALKERRGDVVAVTGDGTNDAPALKEAHIGLSMGIAGTEVAKESSDIIIRTTTSPL